jgi:hypothetical protein
LPVLLYTQHFSKARAKINSDRIIWILFLFYFFTMYTYYSSICCSVHPNTVPNFSQSCIVLSFFSSRHHAEPPLSRIQGGKIMRLRFRLFFPSLYKRENCGAALAPERERVRLLAAPLRLLSGVAPAPQHCYFRMFLRVVCIAGYFLAFSVPICVPLPPPPQKKKSGLKFMRRFKNTKIKTFDCI